MNYENNISASRNKFHIALIDDQIFPAEANLSKLGYNIRTFTDISNVNEMEGYEIILCDLMGVGRDFSSNSQGAFLIKEIKKRYPEKIIIAYSGGSPDQGILQMAISEADKFLNKDARIEEWQEILDDALLEIIDPIRSWQKIRGKLLNNGIKPIELAQLENQFVKSFLKGNEQAHRDLEALCNKKSINKDALKIIFSTISKVIFDQYSSHA